MQSHFPMNFTLESGTMVQVLKSAPDTYFFALTEPEGKTDNFTYVEDNRSREEVEDSLDFDQLNALRAFWLKREELT